MSCLPVCCDQHTVTLRLRSPGALKQAFVWLQAQQMVMDTLGLAACVGLTFSVRRYPQLRLLLPLLTFPFLVIVDLLCIYQELKATHLSTLNRERAEILAERWLLDGLIFTAKEVSMQLHKHFPSAGSFQVSILWNCRFLSALQA